MKNKQFEKLYNKISDISLKEKKQEYDRLKKEKIIDIDFDDFIKEDKTEDSVITDSKKQKKVNDCIILKDIIEKDDFVFNLYLCKFTRVLPPKLKDYKVLPLEKQDYYEYGCILEYNEENNNYSLNNVFAGIELDEHVAKDKYIVLKNKITDNSSKEILMEIEKTLENM